MSRIEEISNALLLLLLEISEADVADGRLLTGRLDAIRKAMNYPRVPFEAALWRLAERLSVTGGPAEGYWQLTAGGYDEAEIFKANMTRMGQRQADDLQVKVAVGLATATPEVYEETISEAISFGDTFGGILGTRLLGELAPTGPAPTTPPSTPAEVEATARRVGQRLRGSLRSPIRIKVVDEQQAAQAQAYIRDTLDQLDEFKGDNEIIPAVRHDLEYMDFVVKSQRVEPETLIRIAETSKERLKKFGGHVAYVAAIKLLDKLLEWVHGLL